MSIAQSHPMNIFAVPLQERRHGAPRLRLVGHDQRRRNQFNLGVAECLATGHRIVEPSGNRSLGYLAAKRAMDIVGALLLIAAFSPVILVTLIALMITTRGRAIFSQERVGFCGKTFRMYKFRTMSMDAETRQKEVKNEQGGPVFKNRQDPRITRLGRVLRSFSIDEMPQLWNVLKGDMALVGPRPPVAKEVVRYEAWQRERLAIQPGLTCLWQVSGRCEIGFEEWVRMDLWYARHQSLATDLNLLFRTPLSVLSRKGAY